MTKGKGGSPEDDEIEEDIVQDHEEINLQENSARDGIGTLEAKPKSVPGPRLRPEEEVEPLGVGLDGGALPGGLVLDEQLLEVEERLPLAALLPHL